MEPAGVGPEVVRLLPHHPLPSPGQMSQLTKRGATIETPLGTFDMSRLEIDPDRLFDGMAEVSADIGWFRSYEVAADFIVQRTQLTLKRKQAELSQYWQQRKAGGEKLTVSDINHNIALDANVQELEDQLMHAKYNLDLLQALRQAYESMARQLQSAVGLYRTEIDADVNRHRLEAAGMPRSPNQGATP